MESYLSQKRQEYLKAFNLIIAKLSESGDFEVFVEVPDVKDTGNIGIFANFRYDVLSRRDGEYYDVNVNVNPDIFDTLVKYEVENVCLSVKSFVWNACILSCDGLIDATGLENWFKHSYGLDNTSMNRKVGRFLHSLQFQVSDNRTDMLIDFGSTDTSDIMALFNIFSKNGIRHIEVTSAYE